MMQSMLIATLGPCVAYSFTRQSPAPRLALVRLGRLRRLGQAPPKSFVHTTKALPRFSYAACSVRKNPCQRPTIRTSNELIVRIFLKVIDWVHTNETKTGRQ